MKQLRFESLELFNKLSYSSKIRPYLDNKKKFVNRK